MLKNIRWLIPTISEKLLEYIQIGKFVIEAASLQNIFWQIKTVSVWNI